MSRSLFVTGTDTGTGKTLVTQALLLRLRAEGLKVAGFKPVAAGAEAGAAGLRNEDALLLRAASAPGLDYAEVNPWCFAPPIAPHLAAREAGVEVTLDALDAAHRRLAARHDWVVTEGAGGWLVPLGAEGSFADWVERHRWPVLLVVGMRLGCINHALLSAEAIRRRTRLAGWVANVLPPAQDRLQANIETLRALIEEPLLGIVPAGASAESAAPLLDWHTLRAQSA